MKGYPIMGVDADGHYVHVGDYLVHGNGQHEFSAGTPEWVQHKLLSGLPYKTPFSGKGLLQWIGWWLSSNNGVAVPGDHDFPRAVEAYNNLQWLISLSLQDPKSSYNAI